MSARTESDRTVWSMSARALVRDPLLRQGSVLALAMLLLHLTTWLYHVVMSRALGPAGYGALSAILGVLLLWAVPVNGVQMGVSAFVARGLARGAPWTAGEPMRIAVALGVTASAGLIAVSPWVSRLLGLTSPAPIVVAAAVLLPWSVLPFLRGWLQGSQQPAALGGTLAIEGVVKLAAGAWMISLGMGLLGAVAGVVLGGLAAVLLALPAALRRAGPEGPRAPGAARGLLHAILPYVLAVGAFSLLTQVDVILVKAIFPARDAGIYAAASTAAKIILYITVPLSMVMLPESIRRDPLSAEGGTVVLRAVSYTVFLGGAVVALYALAPGAVIHVLFGPAYLEGAPLLGVLGLGMLAYELAVLGVYYSLGAGQRSSLPVIAGLAVLFPPLVIALGTTLRGVALVVAASGAVTCAAVWWRVAPQVRRHAAG